MPIYVIDDIVIISIYNSARLSCKGKFREDFIRKGNTRRY